MERINKITGSHNIISWFKSLLGTRPAFLSSQKWCSITITAEHFYFAYASLSKQKPKLYLCQRFDYTQFNSIGNTLKKIVKTNHLEGAHCCWILQPADYKLAIIDALNIPLTTTEYHSALTLKLKNQLKWPVENSIIDSFPIPSFGLADKINKMMVVIAESTFLTKNVAEIQEAGLQLTAIDIPELVFKNLAYTNETEDRCTVLLYSYETSCRFLIIFRKEIYLVRTVDLMLEVTKSDVDQLNQLINRLDLEVQRSLDYFQSEWKLLPTAFHILFAANSPLLIESIHEVARRLNIPAKQMDIINDIETSLTLSLSEQVEFLPILGGLLKWGNCARN